jgi:hypothetical protein
VNPAELVFGILAVPALLGGGVWSVWKHAGLLRSKELPDDPPGTNPRHLRRRAWRRLVCGVLMVLLGLLLAGALLFLEGHAQRLADAGLGEAARPEHQPFLRFYIRYWVVTLALVFALLVLAGFDLWAVRKQGYRLMRRLQDDRRAMLARETALLRQQRGISDEFE